MKKSIKIRQGVTPRLAEAYDVSPQFVWYALNFIKNGPKAEAIRRAALELGGVYVESGFVPTCRIEETRHGFRQIFADDVVLSVNLQASTAEISHHGELVLRIDDVTLDTWGPLAMEAQQLGLEGRFSIPV